MAWNHPHDVYVWINRQLAALAAQELRRNPAAIEIATARLERWKSQPGHIAGLKTTYCEWIEIIQKKSNEELANFLEEDSADADRLRASSPFIRSPFFTEEQRKEISEAAFSR